MSILLLFLWVSVAYCFRNTHLMMVLKPFSKGYFRKTGSNKWHSRRLRVSFRIWLSKLGHLRHKLRCWGWERRDCWTRQGWCMRRLRIDCWRKSRRRIRWSATWKTWLSSSSEIKLSNYSDQKPKLTWRLTLPAALKWHNAKEPRQNGWSNQQQLRRLIKTVRTRLKQSTTSENHWRKSERATCMTRHSRGRSRKAIQSWRPPLTRIID